MFNLCFQADGIEAQGGYQYTGDDGQIYSVSYAAGQGGFQPQGAHIPTSPPIPEEILKALEQNARDEAAGIIDDGELKIIELPKFKAFLEYLKRKFGNEGRAILKY